MSIYYQRFKTTAERFWEKVDKRGDDECWNWTAYTMADGYGVLGGKGGTKLAHRISWVMHNGPIPDELCVCHHCDNPACVNPHHLFIGTQSENIKDMFNKGRDANPPSIKGERHYAAKLTDEKVLLIRRYCKLPRFSQRLIAKLFGVSPALICMVKKNQSWRHV